MSAASLHPRHLGRLLTVLNHEAAWVYHYQPVQDAGRGRGRGRRVNCMRYTDSFSVTPPPPIHRHPRCTVLDAGPGADNRTVSACDVGRRAPLAELYDFRFSIGEQAFLIDHTGHGNRQL